MPGALSNKLADKFWVILRSAARSRSKLSSFSIIVSSSAPYFSELTGLGDCCIIWCIMGDDNVANGGVTDAWLCAPGDAAKAGEWAGDKWGEVEGPTTGTGTVVMIEDVEYSKDVDGCG